MFYYIMLKYYLYRGNCLKVIHEGMVASSLWNERQNLGAISSLVLQVIRLSPALDKIQKQIVSKLDVNLPIMLATCTGLT